MLTINSTIAADLTMNATDVKLRNFRLLCVINTYMGQSWLRYGKEMLSASLALCEGTAIGQWYGDLIFFFFC